MNKFLLPFFVYSLALSSYALADDEGGGRGSRHVLQSNLKRRRFYPV